MTVSRSPATGAVLIAAEAKALSKLQRSGPPRTLASRLTRDDATSCSYAAGGEADGQHELPVERWPPPQHAEQAPKLPKTPHAVLPAMCSQAKTFQHEHLN